MLAECWPNVWRSFLFLLACLLAFCLCLRISLWSRICVEITTFGDFCSAHKKVWLFSFPVVISHTCILLHFHQELPSRCAAEKNQWNLKSMLRKFRRKERGSSCRPGSPRKIQDEPVVVPKSNFPRREWIAWHQSWEKKGVSLDGVCKSELGFA